MIKANELRIGNWINFNGNQGIEPHQINGYELSGHDEFLQKSEPIQLTEEWLLKLGFDDVKKYNNCDYQLLMNDGLFLCITEIKKGFEIVVGQFEDFSYSIADHLKSVHQTPKSLFCFNRRRTNDKCLTSTNT